MYNQQEPGWADGQLNENNERTDDLDGAAEGDNDSSRISVLNQTAPSRPRSRDSYYDRDREMRDRGEPEYYGSRSSRNHGHHGGTEPRRRRNESYRDGRGRERMEEYDYEYRDSRRSRHAPPPERQYPDPYYAGGYGGPPRGGGGGYGGQQQGIREMLERLRVQDPVRYREWYDRYQAHRRNPRGVPNPGLPVSYGYGHGPPSSNYWDIPSSSHSTYGDNSGMGRPVHSDANNRPSGRSSVSELSMLNYDPNPNQSSNNQEPESGFKPIDAHYHKTPEPDRMTPPKYNTSHCLGILTPLGQLIKIKNEGSTVEIVQIKSLVSHLPEFKEVSAFPGPLVKGSTHKNTVIQFCQKKIKEALSNEAQTDKQHFILLWELLILLLRQNGNVVGSDVAELLLKKTKRGADDTSSVDEILSKESSSGSEEEEIGVNGGGVNNVLHPINEAKTTEKFCEYLLYGHKKDAIEYAMNNGLWGHALFLATKMDERTYGNVLARFANCTPFNHPIQTFYQLMSGRQPASTKSCCDETFGDWKPHLAMILSNAGPRPEVEYKSIVKMGDTLANRNHVFAAQFCYLMGQTDFSAQSKLGPLLGLSACGGNLLEATQMTEIYEFARSLAEPTFSLGPSFLDSKLNYSKTLLDLGFVEEAFSYCEEIVKKLKSHRGNPATEDLSILKWSVLQIAERLVRIEESETLEEPNWIQELRQELFSPSSEHISTASQAERRESIPEEPSGQFIQTQEAPPGPVDAPLGVYDSAPNGYSQDYPTEPPPVVEQISSGNTMTDNFHPQPVNPTYEMVPPMYPVENQVPNSGVPQYQDMSSVQGPGMDMQQPMYNQPLYQDPMMPPGSQGLMTVGQGNPPSQPQYSGMPQQPNNMYTPGPEYTTDYPNNNYITPGGGYQMYGQPPPLQDGPMGPSIGANKKKSVRFEDDEKAEDGDTEHDLLTAKLKEIALGEHESNDQFSFCHPLKASARKNYVGYKDMKKSLKDRTDILNYQTERRRGGGSEKQLSSDEIMEEIDRISGARSRGDSSYGAPPHYRNTYPIDEPLPRSRPNSLRTKKTFPIDKPCCADNELCEDHDNFYNGSSSSSLVTTPSGSSPKLQNDNGSLAGAGPSSYYQGKEPPQPKQPPPSKQPNKNESKNKSPEKKDKIGGGDSKKQPGWFSKWFKGPNQMILPDDKDPAIVWDGGKWVNKSGDVDEDSGPKGPPPSDRDLMGGTGRPPPMMSMPPPGAHPMGGGGPQRMQPMSLNQPNMMGQPHNNMPQQQPTFQNQPLPSRPDSLPSASNVPLNNAPGMMPNQPMGNNYPQQNQNQNNYVDGYQNINQQQPYSAAPMNNSSDLSGGMGGGGPSMNGPTSLGNKYKLPKNRNVRSGYVDILNPGATSPTAAAPQNNRIGNGGVGGNMISPAGGAPGVPNMFIPSPISGSGDSGPLSFLTPAPPGPLPAQSQLETNN